MATPRPLSRFGYGPEFSSLKIGSLDDVRTDGVTQDCTLRFNARSGNFENKGVDGRVQVQEVTELGNASYAPATLLKGMIFRDCGGGAKFTDVVPKASELVSAISNARSGDSFEFHLLNTDKEGGEVSLSENTGVTIRGGTLVGAGQVRRFIVLIHSVDKGEEAVELVSLGVTES